MSLYYSSAYISVSGACDDSHTKAFALGICKELSFRGLPSRVGTHALHSNKQGRSATEFLMDEDNLLTVLPLTRKATVAAAGLIVGTSTASAASGLPTVNTSANASADTSAQRGSSSSSVFGSLYLPLLDRTFSMAEESQLELYYAVRKSLLRDANPLVVPIIDKGWEEECKKAVQVAEGERKRAAAASINLVGGASSRRLKSFRAAAAPSNGKGVTFKDNSKVPSPTDLSALGIMVPSASPSPSSPLRADLDSTTPTWSPFETQAMQRFLAVVERLRNACFVVDVVIERNISDSNSQQRTIDGAASQIINLVKELGRAALARQDEETIADGGGEAATSATVLAADAMNETFESVLTSRYRSLGRKANSGLLQRFYLAAGLVQSGQQTSVASHRRGSLTSLRVEVLRRNSSTLPPTPVADLSSHIAQLKATDVFRRILSLDLSMLVLGDVGLGVLCSAALPSLAALKFLNLSDNNITNAGAAMLLQQDQTLGVPTSGNEGSSHQYQPLKTRGIIFHPSLTSINLCNNNISQAGVVDLLLLAIANPLLVTVEISGNLCDDQGVWCRRLKTALAKNAEKGLGESELPTKGVRILSPLGSLPATHHQSTPCVGTAVGKLLIDWEYEPLRSWEGRLASSSLRGRPLSASAVGRDRKRGSDSSKAPRAKSASSRLKHSAGQLMTNGADATDGSDIRRDLFAATLKVTRHASGMNMAATVHALANSVSTGTTPHASTSNPNPNPSPLTFDGPAASNSSINNHSIIAPLHVIFNIRYIVEVTRNVMPLGEGRNRSGGTKGLIHPLQLLDKEGSQAVKGHQHKVLRVLSAHIMVENGRTVSKEVVDKDQLAESNASTLCASPEEHGALVALYEVATDTMLLDTLTIIRSNGGRVRLALGGNAPNLPRVNGQSEDSPPAQEDATGPFPLLRATITALLRRQAQSDIRTKKERTFHDGTGGGQITDPMGNGDGSPYSPLSFSPLGLFSPLSSSFTPSQGAATSNRGSPFNPTGGGPFFFHQYKHDVALKVRYTPMTLESDDESDGQVVYAQPFTAPFFFECKSAVRIGPTASPVVGRDAVTSKENRFTQSLGRATTTAVHQPPPLPSFYFTHRSMCQVTGANVAVYCGDAHDELLQLLEDLGDSLVAAAENEVELSPGRLVAFEDYMSSVGADSVEERRLMMSSGGGERFFSSPTFNPLSNNNIVKNTESSPFLKSPSTTGLITATSTNAISSHKQQQAAARIERLKELVLEEEKLAAPKSQAVAARAVRSMQR